MLSELQTSSPKPRFTPLQPIVSTLWQANVVYPTAVTLRAVVCRSVAEKRIAQHHVLSLVLLLYMRTVVVGNFGLAITKCSTPAKYFTHEVMLYEADVSDTVHTVCGYAPMWELMHQVALKLGDNLNALSVLIVYVLWHRRRVCPYEANIFPMSA